MRTTLSLTAARGSMAAAVPFLPVILAASWKEASCSEKDNLWALLGPISHAKARPNLLSHYYIFCPEGVGSVGSFRWFKTGLRLSNAESTI